MPSKRERGAGRWERGREGDRDGEGGREREEEGGREGGREGERGGGREGESETPH